jgi:hypothetical protein
MKKILFLLILSISFLTFAHSVRAETINIGVYPPIFQATTTPPSDISAPISVYNFTDSPVELKIIIKPFKQSNSEKGEVSYLSNSPTEDFIAKNVRVLDDKNEISSITLSAKEIKKLSLKIKVPQDQSHSDYYFSVIFLSTNQAANASNISSSLGGVATNVLVSVGPQGPTNGEIKEFSTPFFIQGGPVPFTLKIFNKSDHYITPNGQILIQNMFGQTVGKVDLLPVNILSNTSRYIPDLQSYLVSLKNNGLNFDSKTTFWNEKFLLGPYTASLVISLSDSGPTFKKSVYFFAFPAEALITIILIVIIITIIIKRIKKRLNSSNLAS